MQTCSFTVHQAKEIPSALNARTTNDFVPVLAFVFASAKQGIQEIADAFLTYDIKVIGASSGGNIYADNSDQVIYEDSIVITLVDIDEKYFSYLIAEQDDESDFEFGQNIGSWGLSEYMNPHLIILASGLGHNGQDLVEGILDNAGQEITMFGGLAADDNKFEQSFVFSDTKVLENGAIVLAFDPSKIDLCGLATSGWVGLGKDLIITSAEGNIVYSIDNHPALDVYKKYLSVKDTDLPAIGVEYPLLIKRDDDTYALRAVMGVDKEKKSLIFAGTVPQDSIVSFSSSPGFEVMDRTKEKINQFYEAHPKADMLLLFSCMARHLALGPVITEEILFPTEKWGIPMTGFFTYGEIGTNDGKSCDFFNQTYSLVILKEK
jgi:hypothetical protein